MQYQTLGRTNWKISRASLGTWAPDRSVWTKEHDRLFHEGLEAALTSGINFFDTAECYGDGYAENLLGTALKTKRENIYIASKVWFDHLKKEDTIKACENSLRRLGMDYLDLYYIHYPDPQKIVPIEETMEAMLSLKERGLIRAVGVSNFTLKQLQTVCSMGRIEAVQPGYNLLFRTIDKSVRPYCMENQISVIPYSPTATGILTGKYDKSFRLPENDDRNGIFLYSPEYFPIGVELADQIKPIAAKYKAACGQIAINWLLEQEGICSVIIGGKTPEQIKQNLDSFSFTMDHSDLEYLDRISGEASARLPQWTTFFKELGQPMD